MPRPPATAAGVLYDSMLQSALRQFFDRATLDAEPTATQGQDGRLAIEPSANPNALIIRWFGTRYTLRVPRRWVFTAHEVRLAQAIGAVLAARYHAINNPSIIAERTDLFSGAIEDRYVGAFLDHRPYAVDGRDSPPAGPASAVEATRSHVRPAPSRGGARADRIASIIEMLRVAALSSYESRPISTGVLLLGENDPEAPTRTATAAPAYTESLARVKSFFRLADGVRTVFLTSAEGRLLDIVDIARWGAEASRQTLLVPCPKPFQPHARATIQHGNICAVLSPSREIKIFGEGAELFTFRGAAWHLLDVQAKYRLWAEAVGEGALAMRLFQTARDLAEAREGALFLVARDPESAVNQLVARAERLDVPAPAPAGEDASAPTRRDLLRVLEGRTVTDLDPPVLAALAALDGAMVLDRGGRLLAAGAILRHPSEHLEDAGGVIEGARTTAAMAASQFGPVLKVSEDGVITFFDRERVWEI